METCSALPSLSPRRRSYEHRDQYENPRILVDDEDLARQVIREMLAAHPEVEVIAECSNGFDAVRLVAELKPDIIFLDIQMPKLDGFESSN